MFGTVNINAPNVFYNPALVRRLERTRTWRECRYSCDEIFMGLALTETRWSMAPHSAVLSTCGKTRRSAPISPTEILSIWRTRSIRFNGIAPFAVSATVAGETGTVLRRANRGFNVPGGTTIASGPVIAAGLYPENWIVANPQFGNTRYWMNSGSSNYHSLQLQTTLRPVHGLSLQATYVWSKALEVAGINGNGGGLTSGDPTYTNPADRQADYALAGNHVTHDFRSFGTFELPIGPNKLLFGNTSGILARVIEGWQSSFIINASTGQPASVGAANMLYGNGVADIVNPFDLTSGKVSWNGQSGNYFGTGTLAKTSDPQCWKSRRLSGQFCTLQAVTDTTGKILYQNPKPGNRGTPADRPPLCRAAGVSMRR